MRKLLLCLCALAVAGCTTNPESGARNPSTQMVLAPSSAVKLGDHDAEATEEAQTQFMDAYRAGWNKTVETSLASSSVDRAPEFIQAGPPTYPPDMHILGREATVIIDFIVDTDGTVITAHPRDINAQPFQFTAAALVAVWNWRFTPGVKNGKPVRVRMSVPIRFTLSK